MGRVGDPSLPAMNCTYLLPIRRSVFNRAEAQSLRDYLASIQSAVSEIIVVDGSTEKVFAAHHQIWSQVCRHQGVDRRFGFLNDKVNGIQTGVRLATTAKVILADDDIRYDPNDIARMSAMLNDFDVVRPQNYFAFGNAASASSRCLGVEHGQDATLGLQARMEAARMLINRATLPTADYPGTCAFHRETFLRGGGYDGNVLFDNEELIRHFARSGARICYANDFFVRKSLPAFRKWLEQRPRQAYEDFGLRAKTILFALLPLAVAAAGILFGLNMMFLFVALIALLSIGLALKGRARGVARNFFPLHVCLLAPLWVFERSLSTYWAFYWFLRRGGYPFGGRLLQKGIGRDWVAGGRIASDVIVSLRSGK
jgi:hypothetical protein